MEGDISLDDPQVLKQYDQEGMLDRIHEMPWQCQQAWQMAMDFSLPRGYSGVDKVVILGIGGSAIGGDLAASLAAPEAKVPIVVYRGYSPPLIVDERTLVIASSYSGMTEETLSAFEKTLATKAKKLAITTGGRLKAMAEENKIPVFSFDYQAKPRAALGFSFLPILCFLQRLGLVSDKSADVAEAIKVLEALSEKIDETVPSSGNPAKQLAKKLAGRLAVVYGAEVLAEVAHRWKTQLNENSKAWAFHEVLPELNHNAVVGYRFPAELTARTMVVLLHSAALPHRIELRYRVTRQLLEQAGVAYQVVEAAGTSPLAQMMSLILFGDYVSYYLAILYRTDPSPVKVIDYLKEQLAKE
ncbi:MAG: bifunctional phosphoglucose/phosphomannose isomerase [Chloroflexi bacterium]|nr:bifunctional phosphoglucose/phosphomannose isomerase [Chloroflexota bacterium]